MAGGILLFDALSEIPFSKLRLAERPVRFAVVKLSGIVINLSLNLFFLVFCPWALGKEGWSEIHPFLQSVYNKDFSIGYVFLSNLIASAVVLLLLFPQIRRVNLPYRQGTLEGDDHLCFATCCCRYFLCY